MVTGTQINVKSALLKSTEAKLISTEAASAFVPKYAIFGTSTTFGSDTQKRNDLAYPRPLKFFMLFDNGYNLG